MRALQQLERNSVSGAKSMNENGNGSIRGSSIALAREYRRTFFIIMTQRKQDEFE